MDSDNNKTNEEMKKDNMENIDTETKLTEMEAKIDELRREVEDKSDRVKRLMAEFDNFKKRSEKEREALYDSVMGDVAMKLLPVMDNLEKAIQAKTEDTQYKEGVEMVYSQFKDVLESNRVCEIEAVGKPFDPVLHEAIGSVEDDTLGEKIVKEEYRKGYRIGDKVLRHSLVIVAN